ncbi:WSC domain-containing protein [Colletotrichum fructicola]|nr:WSC domain-containing protein [Colletotrichum fructicola]KAF4892386.1 WSC domain-containing protein [Colletotrichum fructicola]KAF4909794.1 WSC domain-containing protein [Colletotrichum fructicola]KAF4933856.1 WSC domain-containing protein [Colletotrichum fructicola]
MHSLTIPGIALALTGLSSAATISKRELSITTSLPTGFKYLGCYTDSPGNRQLARASYVDYSRMTEESCIAFCSAKGFPYVGVEYASECYCDYSLGPLATKQPESDCNFACTGDSTEPCGAGDRLNVFTTTAAAAAGPGVNPGPAGWASLGCYNDNIPGRILAYRTGVAAGDSLMSVLQCTTACKTAGFSYAGVQYSSECYCDNQILSTAASGQAGCNMLCSGNSTEYCGGGNFINVYKSSAAPKTASAVPAGWTGQGCLKDNVLGRALGVGMAVAGGSASMTVESCVAACSAAGYQIAGVEYSQECWCDNQIQNGGVLTFPTDGCNMLCRGNTYETCGGSDRLNIYASYNLNPALPSSSSSSTCFQQHPTHFFCRYKHNLDLDHSADHLFLVHHSQLFFQFFFQLQDKLCKLCKLFLQPLFQLLFQLFFQLQVKFCKLLLYLRLHHFIHFFDRLYLDYGHSIFLQRRLRRSQPNHCKRPIRTATARIVGDGYQVSGCGALLFESAAGGLIGRFTQTLTLPPSTTTKKRIVTAYIGRMNETPSSAGVPTFGFAWDTYPIPDVLVCGSTNNPCRNVNTPLASYTKYTWTFNIAGGTHYIMFAFNWPSGGNKAPVLIDDITVVDA